MKYFIGLVMLLVFVLQSWAFAQIPSWPTQTADELSCPKWYIQLNTDIPFVGRCIEKSTNADDSKSNIANVFVKLTGGLMRILMTAVLITGFLGLLVGWFMVATGGFDANNVSAWKKLIIKVVIGIVLIGASGIILNLINPNFFGTNS